MHWASHGNYAELVITLLDNGAELNAVSDTGYTPLLIAAEQGHLETLNVLLGRGADTEAALTRTKDTALLLAAYGGHGSLVRPYLIDQYI